MEDIHLTFPDDLRQAERDADLAWLSKAQRQKFYVLRNIRAKFFGYHWRAHEMQTKLIAVQSPHECQHVLFRPAPSQHIGKIEKIKGTHIHRRDAEFTEVLLNRIFITTDRTKIT